MKWCCHVLSCMIWKRAQPPSAQHPSGRGELRRGGMQSYTLEDFRSSHVPVATVQLQQTSWESSTFSLGTLVMLVEEDESLPHFKQDFLNKQIIFHSWDFSHKPLSLNSKLLLFKLAYFSFFSAHKQIQNNSAMFGSERVLQDNIM